MELTSLALRRLEEEDIANGCARAVHRQRFPLRVRSKAQKEKRAQHIISVPAVPPRLGRGQPHTTICRTGDETRGWGFCIFSIRFTCFPFHLTGGGDSHIKGQGGGLVRSPLFL